MFGERTVDEIYHDLESHVQLLNNEEEKKRFQDNKDMIINLIEEINNKERSRLLTEGFLFFIVYSSYKRICGESIFFEKNLIELIEEWLRIINLSDEEELVYYYSLYGKFYIDSYKEPIAVFYQYSDCIIPGAKVRYILNAVMSFKEMLYYGIMWATIGLCRKEFNFDPKVDDYAKSFYTFIYADSIVKGQYIDKVDGFTDRYAFMIQKLEMDGIVDSYTSETLTRDDIKNYVKYMKNIAYGGQKRDIR